MLEIKKITTKGGQVSLVTISNRSGASAVLSSLGAGIVAINVPDREGCLADVVLGYADANDYVDDGHCAGKVPGRYANRIARGRFEIDGKEYTLAINNGPNALHGGPTGFQNRLWDIESAEGDTVVFVYHSADGEEGYPGNLTVRATYRWTDDSALCLELRAETDAPTVLNLTNHVYLNLGGHDCGTVLDHILRLNASRYLPTDDTLIPTGDFAAVAGTPMDFTEPKALGCDLHADFPALVYGKGYDNCWVIDGEHGALRLAAVLSEPRSGRTLIVETDQPGVQVYTGNWLSDTPVNKSGGRYDDYSGVAIECQDFPDAPNRPEFPSARLNPGETYLRHIHFRFCAGDAIPQ